MQRFVIHTDSLTERGTEAASFFLARELRKIDCEVAFAYNKNSPQNNNLAIKYFSDFFPLIAYENFESIQREITRNFDIAYLIKNRETKRYVFKGLFNAAHVIFDEYFPFGNTYTYISRSLADYSRAQTNRFERVLKSQVAALRSCMNAKQFEHVPYMVDMPIPKGGGISRKSLGIPDDAFTIIRYGGKTTFDIPWVKRVLLRFLEEYQDTFFIALNTEKFTSHPRVIYLDAVVDLQTKSDLLFLSDLFLHGRSIGETFGMSIIESLQVGTPVISWNGGRDQEHVEHLAKFQWLYQDSFDLWNLLTIFRTAEKKELNMSKVREYSEMFRPQALIKQYMNQMFNLSD